MTAVAILLAILGATCNAISARFQHGGLQIVTGGNGLRLRALLQLAKQRTWLLGVLIAAVGAGLHAAALGLAPLSVVQPIGVLAFALSTVISVRVERIRLKRIAIVAVLASMGGTAAFVLLVATTAKATHIDPTTELHASELVGAIIVVLVVVAVFGSGRLRSLLFAAAAGVAFGYVSLLMRATLQRFSDGVEGFPIFPIAGIVAGILIGGWMVQHAYASGPPEIVIGCLTVVDPLVAVGIGITLLGEGSDTPFGLAVVQAACAIVAIAGIVLLTIYRPRSTSAPHTVTADEQQLVTLDQAKQHD